MEKNLEYYKEQCQEIANMIANEVTDAKSVKIDCGGIAFSLNAVRSKTFYSLNLRTLLVFVAIKLFYLILSNLNNLFRAVAYLFPFLDIIKINT